MRTALIALLFFVASQAQAVEITVPLPLDEATQVEQVAVAYKCTDTLLDVTYVNAGPVSLVVFAFDGQPVVGANVLSASGARYAGAQYIWWNNGRDASLYDLTKGENAAPILECSEV